jgi:hypothetical protein
MRIHLALMSLVLLSPLAALADDEPREAGASGVGLSVGAGVGRFAGEDLRRGANVGTVWEVRVHLGSRNPLALELAYVGGEQSLDFHGLVASSVLVSAGLETVVRLGPQAGALRPYAFAGLGWTRYTLTSYLTEQGQDQESDDVLAVPIGLGLLWGQGQWFAALRGAYRIATYEDLPGTGPYGTEHPMDLDAWTLTLHAGMQF